MDAVLLCPCGKPTHPLYGGRCEDCWASGQHYTDKDIPTDRLGMITNQDVRSIEDIFKRKAEREHHL